MLIWLIEFVRRGLDWVAHIDFKPDHRIGKCMKCGYYSDNHSNDCNDSL